MAHVPPPGPSAPPPPPRPRRSPPRLPALPGPAVRSRAPAAPPPPPPAPPPAPDSETYISRPAIATGHGDQLQEPPPQPASFLGMVRSLREEAINLLANLDIVRSSSKFANDDVRAGEFKSALAAAEKDFKRDRPRVEKLLMQLRYIMQVAPKLYDWAGDTITRIENHWYKAVDSWPNAKTPVANLGLPQAPLNEVVYNSALLTVPGRVNEHLRNVHVGQALDFHDAFVDELPLEDQRKRLLIYLSAQPAAIEGVVDVDSGLIYRASSNKRSTLRNGSHYWYSRHCWDSGLLASYCEGNVGSRSSHLA
jgi:hypothetical protein